jgi:hypothetical protein
MHLWCFDLVYYLHGLILLVPVFWKEIAIVVQFFVIIVLLCKVIELLVLVLS